MAEPRFNVERPTIEGLNDPPHFSNAVVTEGGKMVHLSGQLSPEGDLAAQFKGVYDKLRIGLAACVNADVTVLAPPADMPFGVRQMTLKDVDGNILVFGEPISTESAET